MYKKVSDIEENLHHVFSRKTGDIYRFGDAEFT